MLGRYPFLMDVYYAAGCGAMCLEMRGIDPERPVGGAFGGQGLEHALEDPSFTPAHETIVERLVGGRNRRTRRAIRPHRMTWLMPRITIRSSTRGTPRTLLGSQG